MLLVDLGAFCSLLAAPTRVIIYIIQISFCRCSSPGNRKLDHFPALDEVSLQLLSNLRSVYTDNHPHRPNIPLSAKTTHLSGLNTHTKYLPPHPQRGTPYHRYVTLLLPQPPLASNGKYSLSTEARATEGVPTSVELDIPVVPMEERLHFDVREFVARWGLDAAQGGAAHMWREIWDEQVSRIYQNILRQYFCIFCCAGYVF